jgi:hypothetical protein
LFIVACLRKMHVLMRALCHGGVGDCGVCGRCKTAKRGHGAELCSLSVAKLRYMGGVL